MRCIFNKKFYMLVQTTLLLILVNVAIILTKVLNHCKYLKVRLLWHCGGVAPCKNCSFLTTSCMLGFSHEAHTFLLHLTILEKLALGVAQAPHPWAALETQLPLGFHQARLSPLENRLGSNVLTTEYSRDKN